MAAERRNATVAAVRTAGQTADIRRDLTAARPMDDRVAVGIRRDLTAAPAHLMGDRVAVAGIEAALLPLLTADLAVAVVDIAEVAVPPLAGPAAVAEEDIAEVVAAVRAEEAAVRMRPRHTVAAEGLIGKVVGASPSLALSPFGPGCGFVV